MSLFNELMGSFIRTGNYSLEANYIFPTELALKEFYSNEINASTIHKGLFRIVEDNGDGKQSLYWVSNNLTNNELEFIKLISDSDIDLLFKRLENINIFEYVTTLPVASEHTLNKIYIIKEYAPGYEPIGTFDNESQLNISNSLDEYITIESIIGSVKKYRWEKIGSINNINLSNYFTKEEVEQKLEEIQNTPIANGSITTHKIADGAVNESKLSQSVNDILLDVSNRRTLPLIVEAELDSENPQVFSASLPDISTDEIFAGNRGADLVSYNEDGTVNDLIPLTVSTKISEEDGTIIEAKFTGIYIPFNSNIPKLISFTVNNPSDIYNYTNIPITIQTLVTS